MKKLTILGITTLALGAVLAPLPVQAAEKPIVHTGNNGRFQWSVIIGGNTLPSLPGGSIPFPSLPECELPDFNLPDNFPDIEFPGTGTPDTDNPGASNPDTDKPETDTPGTDAPDTDAPDTDKPETDTPDTDKPETDTPDTDKPDTDKPETDIPGTGTPDTDTPGIDKPDVETPDDQNDAYINQVLSLVNKERAKEGLAPLTAHASMGNAAMVRAREIQTSFSHTRPNGSGFSTALKEAGVTYNRAGENIAWGQKTPAQVVNAWMNSSGHRANIMNPNFTRIGIGYLQNSAGTPYWVQLFAN